MSERDDLPGRLRAHLARELDEVPLAAPDPVDARYRLPVAPVRGGLARRLTTAALLAAIAAAVLGAGAFAAGERPPVVHWIDRLPFVPPPAAPAIEPSQTPEPTPSAGAALVAPRVIASPAENQQRESPEPSEGDHQSTPAPARSTPTPEREDGGGTATPSTGGSDGGSDGGHD